MSGIAIVNYLLSNDANVTGTVPAARIYSGIAPLKVTKPAIALRSVSDIAREIVAQNSATMLWTERVQVSILASDYATKKQVLALVRAALRSKRGTVNGFDCDSIVVDVTGPDLDDPEISLYEQSQDFMVKYYQ